MFGERKKKFFICLGLSFHGGLRWVNKFKSFNTVYGYHQDIMRSRFWNSYMLCVYRINSLQSNKNRCCNNVTYFTIFYVPTLLLLLSENFQLYTTPHHTLLLILQNSFSVSSRSFNYYLLIERFIFKAKKFTIKENTSLNWISWNRCELLWRL